MGEAGPKSKPAYHRESAVQYRSFQGKADMHTGILLCTEKMRSIVEELNFSAHIEVSLCFTSAGQAIQHFTT